MVLENKYFYKTSNLLSTNYAYNEMCNLIQYRFNECVGCNFLHQNKKSSRTREIPFVI